MDKRQLEEKILKTVSQIFSSCVSSRVAARESDLLLSCSRNSEFLSSCCWKLGVSSKVAAGDSELLSNCNRKLVFLRNSSV